MPLIDKKFFELAISNIAKFGDTDVFPLPIENHILFDKQTEAVDLLMGIATSFQERLSDTPPMNHSALAPLGYHGFRWATQIDPLWNAYFLGVVLSLAEDIEDVRVPVDEEVVFSHRFEPNEHHLFDREGWSKFQARSAQLASNAKFVVALDIADFYGRIYHHRLENELKYVDSTSERPAHITKLLMAFSNNVSYGLPVGGPAARILSELLLNAVDRVILDQDPKFVFTRYADDYRFFVDDLESAYRVIGFLSERLQRNEGLSLQRGKTRIMTSSEYLSSAKPQDPRPGSAAKFLNLHLYYDPYSATAEEDYEDLREQLSEFDLLGLLRAELFKGRVDQALTRKLVAALKHMKDLAKDQAVTSLLENLETLAPVIPNVLRAIRDNVDSLPEASQIEVHSRIRALIVDNHHLARVDVNLAYMIHILARRNLPENARLLTQLFERPHGHAGAPAPNIQHDILLILAKWGRTHVLHDRKPHYLSMHPWVRRAFSIGSFALGDEGKHWRQSTSKSLPPFDKLSRDWMSARVQQPEWEIPV